MRRNTMRLMGSVPPPSHSPSAPAAPPPVAPGPTFAADWKHAAETEARRPPIVLKPSRSKLRRPSVFFSRGQISAADEASLDPVTAAVAVAAYAAPSGSVSLTADELGLALPLYKVTSATCDYFALRIPLLKAGFKRVGPQHRALDPNVLWGKSWPATAFRPSRAVDAQWRFARPVHRFQTINHFAGSHATLGCKAGMVRTLGAAKEACLGTGHAGLASEIDRLAPRTWRLPVERAELESVRADKRRPVKRFIVKPARGSCGRGIKVVDPDSALLRTLIDAVDERAVGAIMDPPAPEEEPGPSAPVGASSAMPPLQQPQPPRARQVVVQEYMEDPYLIKGRKFDLRVYVGVTSFDPLVAYVHRDGLVRFAAEEYRADSTDHRFGHLTNYSLGRRLEHKRAVELAVQQGLLTQEEATAQLLEKSAAVASSPGCDAAPSPQTDDKGPGGVPDLPKVSLELKWSMAQLQAHVAAERGQDAWDTLTKDIDRIIAVTLAAAARPINALASTDRDGGVNRCSFELLGFDVMIDDTLRPWLIEVNTLPSLESSSTFDYAVKSNVSTDLLNLAQVQLFERLPEAFAPCPLEGEGLDDVESLAMHEGGALAYPSALTHTTGDAAKAGLAHPLTTAWAAHGELGALGHHLSRSEDVDDLLARVEDEREYRGGFRPLFPSAAHRDVAEAVAHPPCHRSKGSNAEYAAAALHSQLW